MSNDETPPLKVTDRRQFRPQVEEAPPSLDSVTEDDTLVSEDPIADSEVPSSAGEAPQEASRRAPRSISFSNFVLSLGTSAMVHLGEVADPNTNEVSPDLELARQTIDVLGILQEKTKGNLTTEEESLMRNLLTDLRMRFVLTRQG